MLHHADPSILLSDLLDPLRHICQDVVEEENHAPRQKPVQYTHITIIGVQGEGDAQHDPGHEIVKEWMKTNGQDDQLGFPSTGLPKLFLVLKPFGFFPKKQVGKFFNLHFLVRIYDRLCM